MNLSPKKISYFTLSIGLLCIFQIKAQTNTESNVQVEVSAGTVVSYNSDWQNDGTINNDGSVSISGDWTNNGTYSGSGTLNFDGATVQVIQHNDQGVQLLIISGGGEKQLQSDLTVLGSMDLQDGLLTPA